MPYPKLSGILNNCALHAITPELKEQNKLLSHNEDSVPASLKANYEILKSLFAEYYGLSSRTFSWKAFNQLLAAYNSFDLQILMGPVLRKFMEHQIDHQSIIREKSRAEYIKKMTSIQSNGRYNDMDPDELFHFVAKPLGFQVAYLEADFPELI